MAPLLRLASPSAGRIHRARPRTQLLRIVCHLRSCPITRGHPPGAHSRSHTFAQSCLFAKAVLTGCLRFTRLPIAARVPGAVRLAATEQRVEHAFWKAK